MRSQLGASYVAHPGLLLLVHDTSGLRHWLKYAAPAGAIHAQGRNRNWIQTGRPNSLILSTPVVAANSIVTLRRTCNETEFSPRAKLHSRRRTGIHLGIRPPDHDHRARR